MMTEEETNKRRASEVTPKRPKEVQHDEAPSGVTDHPFEPKGLWFTLCKHCNLAESAHAETTLHRPTVGRRPHFHYVGDDDPDS